MDQLPAAATSDLLQIIGAQTVAIQQLQQRNAALKSENATLQKALQDQLAAAQADATADGSP